MWYHAISSHNQCHHAGLAISQKSNDDDKDDDDTIKNEWRYEFWIHINCRQCTWTKTPVNQKAVKMSTLYFIQFGL